MLRATVYMQSGEPGQKRRAASIPEQGFTMKLRHAGSSLVVAIAALSLAACSKGHETPHASAEDANAPHAVVVTPGANMPSKREIAALFDDWNQTLRTGGPNDMALLYAEDGILLPTVSNLVRSNRVEIADYFEHFLELHPRGVINEQHIDVLDSNTAVNSGVYTFDLIKEGEPTFVVARYSFLYEKIGGKWLIKSHHSSAMPEPVTVRPPALATLLASNDVVAPVEEAHAEPAAAEEHAAPKAKGHAPAHH
jgi:uncharacterized protein (TIGR02246 family)